MDDMHCEFCIDLETSMCSQARTRALGSAGALQLAFVASSGLCSACTFQGRK